MKPARRLGGWVFCRCTGLYSLSHRTDWACFTGSASGQRAIALCKHFAVSNPNFRLRHWDVLKVDGFP